MKYLLSPFVFVLALVIGIITSVTGISAMVFTFLSIPFAWTLSELGLLTGGRQVATFFLSLLTSGVESPPVIKQGSAYDIDDKDIQDI